MSKRLLDFAFSLGICLVAIWFWFLAEGFPKSPRYENIDSDFWPKITFGLMALTSGLLALGAFRDVLAAHRAGDDPDAEGGATDWGAIVRMVAMGALVLAYFVGFGQVGFLIATVVFLWLAAFMLPSGRVRAKLLFPPIFTIALALLFSRVLSLPLPRGVGPFYELSLLLY